MAKLFANSGDPDQTPRSLHCLPITLVRVSRLQWVNAVSLRNNQIKVLFHLLIDPVNWAESTLTLANHRVFEVEDSPPLC